MKLTGLDAKIRIYDGNGKYIEMALDSMDFSGPLAAPTHEQTLVLNRGKVDAFAFYAKGGDAPVMEPVAISFSAMLADHEKCFGLLDMLEGNPVNGTEMVTTKGTGARLNGISVPFDGDDRKCYDIEYCATGNTKSFCLKYSECHFELGEQTFSEAEDSITLSLTANCYGAIKRQLGFSEGEAVI